MKHDATLLALRAVLVFIAVFVAAAAPRTAMPLSAAALAALCAAIASCLFVI